MNNLCIIPARGGSKRIPRKNIEDFAGKPIISYSIDSARQSRLFNSIVVSTEDKEIADTALAYKAEVPFFRSNENANDFAGLAEVCLEVIQSFKAIGKEFDIICCFLATAPFVTPELLNKAYSTLSSSTAIHSVFPVTEYSYPIERSLKESDGFFHMKYPENLNMRSQDFTPTYHDAGQFYFIRTTTLEAEKKFFTSSSQCIVLDNLQVQDIDNETDWKLAELKYNLLLDRN